MSDRETWRLCTRHDGYLVSDLGRVRRIGGRILKPQRNTKGYRKVHLGRRRQALVHRLVADAFHGPGPVGHEVDHLNWEEALAGELVASGWAMRSEA